MKLYSRPLSPFGRTVQIVAAELGLMEDIELVDTPVVPASRNEEFAKVNPLCKIPALVTEDGLTLADSALIAEYLCARVGDTRMFAKGGPDEWRVRANYILVKGASDAAVNARYEIGVRPEDKRWDDWFADQMVKLGAALDVIAADPPAAEGRLTIDAIALAVLLEYLDLRFPDFGWRGKYPTLEAWLAPLSVRPSFVATPIA